MRERERDREEKKIKVINLDFKKYVIDKWKFGSAMFNVINLYMYIKKNE